MTDKSIKQVIILGASSGIGRELARIFGQNPELKLGLAARRVAALEELAAELPADCVVRELDLAAPDRGEKFAALMTEFPRIDLILYAAGYGEINPALDWKLCHATLEVNVCGFTEIANLAYLRLAGQRHGKFAAIASVGGLRGFEDDSGYSAGKSYMIRYLEGLARKAAKEKSGVRIATILPGFVDTAMAKGGGYFWMCSAPVAAAAIVRGLARNRRYFYVTCRWRLVAWLLALMPRGIFEHI